MDYKFVDVHTYLEGWLAGCLAVQNGLTKTAVDRFYLSGQFPPALVAKFLFFGKWGIGERIFSET